MLYHDVVLINICADCRPKQIQMKIFLQEEIEITVCFSIGPCFGNMEVLTYKGYTFQFHKKINSGSYEKNLMIVLVIQQNQYFNLELILANFIFSYDATLAM